MPQKIFVIYGRDQAAHEELVRFISSLGLEELSFDSIGNSLGPNPFIADIVVEGVSRADAVIALFTPDEQAALYSPNGTLVHEAQAARWQSRPNVIFEAGLAYGLNKSKTVLVTLGTDVSLFSDVSGIHFVKLDDAQGKVRLRDRLAQIVPVTPQSAGWFDPDVSGDFARITRRRWKHYDEIDSLENRLRETSIGDDKIPLLWILQSTVSDVFQEGSKISAKNFMESVRDLFGNPIAEKAYWELVLAGFFTFNDTKDWWEVQSWQSSSPFAHLTTRGEMLLSKLSNVVDEPLQLENTLFPRHKEVNDLIMSTKLTEALALNSVILKEYPLSSRAHFNQARINAQMSLQSPDRSEHFLVAARADLANALELGIVRLNILTGFPEERRKPQQIIREDPDLHPIFQRWPDIAPRLANPRYIRERTGGRGCVGANMDIEMADCRIKPAGQIRVGDTVMAWNLKESSRVQTTVTAVCHFSSADTLILNQTHWFTAAHPLLTPAGWVCAGQVTLGTQLCLGKGGTETIVSIEKTEENCEVVDITVKPHSTFIAGGLVVHNKK